MNSRLDTLQAAILSVKLQAFKDYELERINAAAELYNERLAGILTAPTVPEGYYSSWAQYTVRFESGETRGLIQRALKAKGIPTAVYYSRPMHSQTAFAYLPSDPNDYAVTDMLCDTVLSLPIHPYITPQDIETVSESIKQALVNK